MSENVVIFDDHETSVYRDQAASGVSDAGFNPVIFSAIGVTLQHLHDYEYVDAAPLAIVTSLGNKATGERFKFDTPAHAIVSHAVHSKIPLAMLSGSKAARRLRGREGDIVIPKQPHQEIAPRIAEWLGRIVQAV